MPQFASRIFGAVLALMTMGLAARADDALFLPVADSFVIAGMGVVATGTIARGSVKTGDAVELVGIDDPVAATVLAVQQGTAMIDGAAAGTEVSVILRGVNQDQVERGRVIAAPDVLKAHARIVADVTLLETGGRSRPAADGYRPLLKIWTHSVTGEFELGSDQIAPGATARCTIVLQEPSAVLPGDTFDITEGGRSVGTGVVVKVQN
jgi:elongation factor Tu